MRRDSSSYMTLFFIFTGIIGVILILWAWRLLPFLRSVEDRPDDAFIRSLIIPIHNPVAGIVAKIYVQDYANLKKGDLILSLDKKDAQLDYDKACALLKAKQEELKALPHNSTKTQSIEQELVAAQDAVSLAKIALEKRDIRAPIDGEIADLNIVVGQYLPKDYAITSLVGKKMWIIAHFKESQINRLHKGQKVDFTFSHLPGKVFSGVISALSPATAEEFLPFKIDRVAGNLVKLSRHISVRIDFPVQQPGLENIPKGVSVKVLMPKDQKGL